MLLAIDENNSPLTHEQASKAFRVKPVTITRLRQRLVEEGLEMAVHGKRSHHGSKPKLDGDGQAISLPLFAHRLLKAVPAGL